MRSHTVSIEEAEGHLAELFALVQKGEDVVISQNDKLSIKLVICGAPSSEKRVPGLHKGAFRISDDFNDPLDESVWVGQD